MNIRAILLISVISGAFAAKAPAADESAPKLPFIHPLYDSHMVLPRDVENPVWGWAEPGESVTVEVKDASVRTLQRKTARAGTDGRWDAAIGPFKASERPLSLVFTRTAHPPVTLTDVLVGDVWLCSGQSNMARSLAFHKGIPNIPDQDEEIADTINYPLIRQYYVGNAATALPQLVPTSLVTDETGQSGPWLVNNPVNAARPSRYSAVGYFFGRQLHRTLKIPIGIVQMSWGGTSIEAWIDPVTLAQDLNFPQAATLPDKVSSKNGGAIYNGKVATLLPFKFKGVVWYQGENNEKRPEQYRTLLPLLLKSWRQAFQQPALPFIVIQLPNYKNDNWAILRDAQFNAVRHDPRSRLVVTLDLGDKNELHPANKQDVATRAARAALDLAYGQKLVSSGPLFSRAVVEGKTVRCEFTDVGAGLMVGRREIPPTKPGIPTLEDVGGTLTGFEIAGPNGTFFPARAIILSRDTVEISSPEVTSPISVRYAWAGSPVCNLYNKITDPRGGVIEGLPASPFLFPAIPTTIAIGDARLAYDRAGSGTTVILLHAHSVDRRLWEPQFAELAKHFDVIRYDLRGYGQSSLPADEKTFRHEADLLALMDTLGVEKAHLVGLSLGSWIALDFLAAHPDRVLSVAVAAGGLRNPPDATPADAQRQAIEAVRQQGVARYKADWLEVLLGMCGPQRETIHPALAHMVADWSAWQALHPDLERQVTRPTRDLLQKKPKTPARARAHRPGRQPRQPQRVRRTPVPSPCRPARRPPRSRPFRQPRNPNRLQRGPPPLLEIRPEVPAVNPLASPLSSNCHRLPRHSYFLLQR